MTIETEKMDGIIRKVKGLLATAADNANENEAQAAFVMAQKMMMKYNIEQSELIDEESDLKVTSGQASAYKTLRWYDRMVVSLIMRNFRVKGYYEGVKKREERTRKDAVMFYGLEEDVKLAKEVYVLMVEALEHYARLYVENYYREYELERDRTHTSELKNSYMTGFIYGMQCQFDQQREEIEQEYGIVVVTPVVVEDSYKELSKTFDEPVDINIPTVEEMEAYIQGVKDGGRVDYTRNSIEDNI